MGAANRYIAVSTGPYSWLKFSFETVTPPRLQIDHGSKAFELSKTLPGAHSLFN